MTRIVPPFVLFLLSLGIGWWIGAQPGSPAAIESEPQPQLPTTIEPAAPAEERAAAPELPAIDGELWGRVRTPGGDGVGAVEIVAWPAVPTFDKYQLVPDLDTALRRIDRAAVWREKYRVSGITDETGEYRITGLVAADYHVEATSPRTRRAHDKGPVSAGEYIEFVANTLQTRDVIVKVDDPRVPEPQPWRHSYVVVPTSNEHMQLLLSLPTATQGRADGHIVVTLSDLPRVLPLTEGTELWARRSWPTERSAQITYQGKKKELTLPFPEQGFLAVRVHYPPGTTERVLWIGLAPLDNDGVDVDAETFRQVAQWFDVQHSVSYHEIGEYLPSGHYRIGGVLGDPPTMWSMGNRQPRPSPHAAVEVFADVEVVGGRTPVVLEIEPRDYTDGIMVTVIDDLDRDERPFVAVVIPNARNGQDHIQYLQSETLPDGRVFFFGYGQRIRDRLEGREPGGLIVRANLFATTAEAPILPGQPATAEVRFERPRPITITFELPPNVSGDQIGCYTDGFVRSTPSHVFTTERPPGAYSFSYASMALGGKGSFALGKHEFVVGGSPSHDELVTIEPLYRLEIVAPTGDQQGAVHFFSHEDGREGFLTTNEAPSAIYLPTGEYTIANGETFTIPDAQTLDLSKNQEGR